MVLRKFALTSQLQKHRQKRKPLKPSPPRQCKTIPLNIQHERVGNVLYWGGYPNITRHYPAVFIVFSIIPMLGEILPL